jgi:hypothetical protein
MERVEAGQPVLVLAPLDNVAVARRDLLVGEVIQTQVGPVAIGSAIPRGHKIAHRPIGLGDKIIKYGAPIGSATRAIALGEHVHVHNVRSDYTPTHLIHRTDAEP